MFAEGVKNATEGEAKARATKAVFIELNVGGRLEVDLTEKSCCDSLRWTEVSDDLRDPVLEIEDKIMNHLHERSGNQNNLS